MRDSAATARCDLLAQFDQALRGSNLRPVGHDVMLAVYDRAGKQTAGGIIIPQSNREDEFQGKTCLVLALGPMCKRSPDFLPWFDDDPPKPGDWVGINVRDGISMKVGDMSIRLVEWKYLRFQTDAHDVVM